MAIDYTTTGLVASVKRRITLPDAQNLYTADDLIAFMGDELSSTIVPLVHSVQQEYWVVRHDEPLVMGQLNYTIPVRGVANCLRLLTLVDTNGNEIAFSLLRPENTASTYNWLSPYSTSTLYGFNMEDDHIVMFPKQFVANPVMSLRFRFERQPNQLCSVNDAAQITGILGNVVTVNNIPSTWNTTTVVDLIKGIPAFISKGDDLTLALVNVGLSQITFTALPSTAAIGDWISVAGTSPVPQIPYQLFPYLAQCVAIKCLEGLADLEPYNAAVQQRERMKEDILKMLQPRDMGNVQTIVNRGGLFDSGQFWGWSGGNYWLLLIGLSCLTKIL
jgi:hypothetical protein